MSPTSGRGSPKHHIGGSPHIEGPPHPEEGEPRVQSYVASLPPTSSQEGKKSDLFEQVEAQLQPKAVF